MAVSTIEKSGPGCLLFAKPPKMEIFYFQTARGVGKMNHGIDSTLVPGQVVIRRI